MTRKSTKRAMLFSVLALVLCMSMFVGTTYAWFTDSVTSANNVIQSGNLDIDVQYTLDGENWADLEGAEDLFQKGLWEPGHTELVALKVTNKGSLALKYAAFINVIDEVVGKTKDGKDIVLSDILTVSTAVFDAGDIGDVFAKYAFSGENAYPMTNTTSFKNGNVLTTEEILPVDYAKYVLIKIDMPETVGNEANHDGVNVPAIEFGVNVVATQLTEESDSFGNDYDADAKLPTIVSDKAALVEALANGDDVALSNDIVVDGSLTLNEGTAIYGNGNTIKNVTLHAGDGAVIENVVFDGVAPNAKNNLSHIYSNGSVTVNGCTFKNSNYDAVQFVPVAGSTIVITDCVFGAGNAYRSIHIEPKPVVGADDNNGITLVLENNYIDISRLVEGKTYYENQICIVGVFAKNITASNNTIVYGGDTLSENAAWTGTHNGTKWVYWNDAEMSEYLAFNYVTGASNAENLSEALLKGDDVTLTEDLTLVTQTVTVNGQTEAYGNKVGVAQYGGTFDGNGNTLADDAGEGYLIVTHGGTIKNVTITGGERGIVIYAPTEDVKVDNVVINGPGYAINTAEHNGQNLIVTNSTINGWTSFAGLDSASFTNCKFGANTTKYWQNMGYDQDFDRLVRPYMNTTFESCEFEQGFYIDLSALAKDCKITLTGCESNGVTITADNYADYITIELPSGRSLADCVVFN